MIKTVYPFSILRKIPATAVCVIGMIFFFSACKIYKPAYYFRDISKDTIISGFVTNDLELKIQKNDVLSISISSLNVLEDALYNKLPVTATSAGLSGASGFQVSPEGNIYLHKLGKIAVAGLTRKELKAKLENDLLPYLKDPIATINFLNHRVTVLGDQTSMTIEMPEEKIPLLEVLATSKAGTMNSKLDQVMVIRETSNTKEVKYVNLENHSIFTSPWYYLQPNDIVVIKPNEEKLNDEQKRAKNQMLYTTILAGVSFLIIVIDRIFR